MVNQVALDSNTAIAFLNGDTSVFDFIDSFDLILLPATVCGELLYGANNSGSPDKNLRNYRTFIQNCALITVDLKVAEEYAAVRLALRKLGKPIPENDIWIAATCMARNIPLFTFDKHFQNVPGLDLVGFSEENK